MSLFWVFIGGGLGSVCRYSINSWLQLQEHLFPWATLTANIISCILLGFLVSLGLKNAIQEPWRLMLMTGFCGGFSTFSTFSSETFQLFATGHHFYALANILVSVLVCLLGVWIGIKAGEQFLQHLS